MTKSITGAAAAQHGLIAIFVDCGPQNSRLLIVPAGDTTASTVTITGLPAPITCTVIEFLDGATDSVQVTTAGLGPVALAPGDAATVTVTDDYQLRPASLVITKLITGDGAALHGAVQITVTCDGDVTTLDMPAGEVDPEPFTLEGVPPGSTCVINEPLNGGVQSLVVSTTPVLPLALGPFPAGGTLEATITNDYTLLTGRLLVIKEISGPAAEFRDDVTLTVECSDGTTESISLPPGASATALEIGLVPFGTTCTVTEPLTGAIDDVIVETDFEPSDEVTINESLEIVTVANSYSFATGTVELVKEFEGPAAAERGTVRMRLACGDQVIDGDIPAGETAPPITLDVPSRTRCLATELNNGATSGVNVATTFEPASRVVTAIAGETVTITATNTYTLIPTGSLLVESILAGPAEPRRDTVRLTVTCDSGRTASLTFPPGRSPDPALLGGIPSGSQCTVEQPLDGDTDSILTTTSGVPTAPVEILSVITVQVTNVYTDPVTPTPSPPTPSPPPTPNPPQATAPKPLPATGADIDQLLIGAIAMFGIGATLWWGQRRMSRRGNLQA